MIQKLDISHESFCIRFENYFDPDKKVWTERIIDVNSVMKEHPNFTYKQLEDSFGKPNFRKYLRLIGDDIDADWWIFEQNKNGNRLYFGINTVKDSNILPSDIELYLEDYELIKDKDPRLDNWYHMIYLNGDKMYNDFEELNIYFNGQNN